ncbi:hypothetical protein TWF106_009185 [Orbilia oligospora]|uniref:WW domain-containing protein n=1 Tax=Orbilia oligospora TaxID=2813651 RepID=A0A7C8QXZ0_ORBOL|nr:hypothetical protein TWF106_009185 [Orbilia oligospora]
MSSGHPPSASLPPLPKGWTEHRAPTGHNYYYHAETKTSTYTRPVEPAHAAPLPNFAPQVPPQSYQQPNQFNFNYPRNHPQQYHHANQGQFQPPRRPRHQDKPDKPKTKRSIPDAAPWVLVTTKKGNTFIHNPETKESLWDAPESLKSAIESLEKLSLDEERERERIRRRQSALERQRREQEEAIANQEEEYEYGEEEYYEPSEGEEGSVVHGIKRQASAPAEGEEGDYYDDEDFDEEHDEKRLRMETGGLVEFTEDDIAWQLGDIAAQYGLGEEDLEETDDLAPEDGALLFKDLLNDLNINPYSTWDSELPKLVEDGRYTALPTTKMRKQVFGEWCQERIAEIKKEKEKEVKKDPRVAYLAFIEANATPKLYWPEFKRKFKKEAAMKDVKITDKVKETYYRDYISRKYNPTTEFSKQSANRDIGIKTSVETRENDLKKYLKTVKDLRRGSTLETLPPSVECDIRYTVVPKDRRDPIVEAHIKSLPEDAGEGGSSNDTLERQRRALEDREAAVRRERFYNQKDIARGKEALRETEMEIKRAMNVGKEGLLGHLEPAKEKDEEEGEAS